MTILNTADILAQENFRTAPTHKDKILEAARLFNEGAAGKSNHATYRLREAMTTSDFPTLLSKAFEVEAMQAQKDAVKEYEQFAYKTSVPDFRPKKLRDLFTTPDFDEVNEGEEYKAAPLEETDVEVRAHKHGRVFGYTWELAKSGDFTGLADFPRRLGNGAVETENKASFSEFVGETGPREDFFETVDTKPLTAENLDAAINGLALTEDHRGDLVDTTKMVLVVPPTLAVDAQRLVGAAELEMEVTEGNKKTKTRVQNPFRGLVEVVVSRWLVRLNKNANRSTAWYLLPAGDTTNPSVIAATMLGHETVDIRVKRDQGERVGGGAVPFEDGSFGDDTVWFRGRHVFGTAKAFAYAAYASKGA